VIEESGKDLLDLSGGDYLVFSMKKTRYTTENAVQQIAKTLGINRRQIGYAGSKDSQAVTTQNITINGVSKEKILGLNLKDIQLTFLGFRKNPLSLGDLDFNKFEITIRNINAYQKRFIAQLIYLASKGLA
jgi:tRNA pseudouridine13 synthase